MHQHLGRNAERAAAEIQQSAKHPTHHPLRLSDGLTDALASWPKGRPATCHWATPTTQPVTSPTAHAHAPRGVGATVARSARGHVRHHDAGFGRAQRLPDLLKLRPGPSKTHGCAGGLRCLCVGMRGREALAGRVRTVDADVMSACNDIRFAEYRRGG